MSNEYKATGRIISVGETVQASEKFRRRNFVMEIADGQYPQTVEFQLAQAKCEDIGNRLQTGRTITVTFNLRGRTTNKDGNARTYNTLECWKVESAQHAEPEAMPVDDSDIPF